MRVFFLVLVLALSGCFDDAPVREPMEQVVMVEEVEEDSVAANETLPVPRVLNITGGYEMRVYSVVYAPHGASEMDVPPDTPWILEVSWREEEPGPMSLTVFGNGAWTQTTGESPLRIEFPEGDFNGTVELDLSPDLRQASNVTYHAFASLFEAAPFDPEWSALPPEP